MVNTDVEGLIDKMRDMGIPLTSDHPILIAFAAIAASMDQNGENVWSPATQVDCFLEAYHPWGSGSVHLVVEQNVRPIATVTWADHADIAAHHRVFIAASVKPGSFEELLSKRLKGAVSGHAPDVLARTLEGHISSCYLIPVLCANRNWSPSDPLAALVISNIRLLLFCFIQAVLAGKDKAAESLKPAVHLLGSVVPLGEAEWDSGLMLFCGSSS